MACGRFKELMMASLDGEICESDRAELGSHLAESTVRVECDTHPATRRADAADRRFLGRGRRHGILLHGEREACVHRGHAQS